MPIKNGKVYTMNCIFRLQTSKDLQRLRIYLLRIISKPLRNTSCAAIHLNFNTFKQLTNFYFAYDYSQTFRKRS